MSAKDRRRLAITEAEMSLLEATNPSYYLRRLGLESFHWQKVAMDPTSKRVLMLTCRQAGKSTVIAGKVTVEAKYVPGSLELVTCPAQDQSKELLKKVDAFLIHDTSLQLKNDAAFEKEFHNGSRIVALPGTERSVRGYSKPSKIIVDEAARVQDETIYALRPMMASANTELIMLSTPWGKRGYFHKQWQIGKNWKKILVRVAWDLVNGKLQPSEPEEQFHSRMLKQGILAYYSPRHDLEFLQNELDEGMDELWFRQEYMCEFVEELTNMFTREMIDRAMDDSVQPLFRGALSEEVEPLEVAL